MNSRIRRRLSHQAAAKAAGARATQQGAAAKSAAQQAVVAQTAQAAPSAPRPPLPPARTVVFAPVPASPAALQTTSAALPARAPHAPGPKSPQARQRIRLNAYQHGLTGQFLMVPVDEMPFYNATSAGFHRRFQPADSFEAQLLQKIIDTNWRLNICAALETNLFGVGAVDYAESGNHDDCVESILARCRAWSDMGNQFERLGRYETSLNRRFIRLIAELERAQAARVAREQRAQSGQTVPPQECASALSLLSAAQPEPAPETAATPAVSQAAVSSQLAENEPVLSPDDLFRKNQEPAPSPSLSDQESPSFPLPPPAHSQNS